MVDVATLPELNPEQLRELAHQLIAQIASKDTLIHPRTLAVPALEVRCQG
jgi:hypothetical protein